MMHLSYLKHQFVDHLPDYLQEGVLYISMKYSTAAHCCACGCGQEVITPFSPTDWKMIFDGETITLSPSIGNWNFLCRSHYFIRHNQVIKAANWTKKEVMASRLENKALKAEYYEDSHTTLGRTLIPKTLPQVQTSNQRFSLSRKLLNVIRITWKKLYRALKN